MCKCTPNMRTPFCGKPGCEWPEENKTVFDLNDRVSAFGVEGVVTAIECEAPFEVRVRYKTGHYEMFTKEGKANLWHLEPSLKLIEKAKKKVKKKFYIVIGKNDIEEMCIRGSYILKKEEIINKNELEKDFQITEIEIEVEE